MFKCPYAVILAQAFIGTSTLSIATAGQEALAITFNNGSFDLPQFSPVLAAAVLPPGQDVDISGADYGSHSGRTIAMLASGNFDGSGERDYVAFLNRSGGGYDLEVRSMPAFIGDSGVLLAKDTSSYFGSAFGTIIAASAADLDGDGTDELFILRDLGSGNLDLLIRDISLGDFLTGAPTTMAAEYFTFDTINQERVQTLAAGDYYGTGIIHVAALATNFTTGTSHLRMYEVSTTAPLGMCCSTPMAADSQTFSTPTSFNYTYSTSLDRDGDGVDELGIYRENNGDFNDRDLIFYNAPVGFDATLAESEGGEYWMFDRAVEIRRINLQPAKTRQVIDGIGASSSVYALGLECKSSRKESIRDSLYRDMGLSIIRVPLLPWIEPSNDNLDPSLYRPAAFNDCNSIQVASLPCSGSCSIYTVNCDCTVARTLEAVSDAVNRPGSTIKTVVACAWSPPGWMKNTNSWNTCPSGNSCSGCSTAPVANRSGTCGGTWNPSMRSEYVEWVRRNIDMYAQHGVQIDYISIQNEPTNSLSHESMELPPAELYWIAIELEGTLQATMGAAAPGIMVMDAAKPSLGVNAMIALNNFDNSFIGGPSPLVSVVSVHDYEEINFNGTYGNDPYSSGIEFFGNACALLAPNVRRWQTESSRLGNDSDYAAGVGISGAVDLAQHLFRGFNDAGLNAWFAWHSIWPLEDLTSSNYEKVDGLIFISSDGLSTVYSKQYYALRQFSQFLSPGARIATPYWDENSANIPGDYFILLSRGPVDAPNGDFTQLTLEVTNAGDGPLFLEIELETQAGNWGSKTLEFYKTTGANLGDHNMHSQVLSHSYTHVFLPIRGKGVYTLAIHD